MILWFMLWASICFSLFLYSYPDLKNKGKNLFVFIIALILTYFSAFRFELGQDYEGYTDVIRQNSRTYETVEPGYTFLVKFINNYGFSEVLFFLVFAIITNFFIVYTFSRYKNFQLMIIVYISFSVLYFNTFNIVRQYAAAAIIFFGFRFIERRYFLGYIVSVFFATLFHVSALFCIPIYFLWNLRLPKFLMVFVATSTLFFGSIFSDQLNYFVHNISSIFNIYILYLDDETNYQPFGLLTICFNLLLFWILYNLKDLEMKSIDSFILCGFFILTILYNLIPGLFYLQRLAVYFLIFFPLVLSVPTYNNKMLRYMVIMTSIVFFLYFIVSSSSNIKVIPSSMKTISDLRG